MNSLKLLFAQSLLILRVLADCSADYFPVYSGGLRAEIVNCFLYDDTNQLIIIGGESNSADYVGPVFTSDALTDPHGFLYALDLDGNWQWGRQYFNGTGIVTNITGCQMSSNKKSLSVLGMQDQTIPVVMEVDPLNGKTKRYTAIAPKDASIQKQEIFGDKLYWHRTFGAIYNDNHDVNDGQDYTYASYIDDGLLTIVKLHNQDSEAMKFDPVQQKLISSS